MISKSSLSTLSLDQLKQAVELKEQIANLESQLANILGGASSAPVVKVGGGRGGRRNLSPEARERIANAQRARWAKFHQTRTGGKAAGGSAKATAASSGMSAEGRARIVAAQKARWARYRALKRK